MATSSSADDTAIEEARDEVNVEWEVSNAGDIDGHPEIDNGNDSKQRSGTIIVCQGVEWHTCGCVSDDVRMQPQFSIERVPVQYFKKSFPTQMVPDILMWS